MVRFGITGTGKINHTFTRTVLKVPDFWLEAAYSRSVEKGREFARPYGANKIYTSLEELGNDSNVNAVYIASPNSFHCSQSICILNHGKHVLCEKPIASTTGELKSMTEAAGANGKILLEAIRPVSDPGFVKIKELLSKVGRIWRAIFQYCQYSFRYDAFREGIIENAFSPTLSNAVLMDIGAYCIHPMVLLFGKPDRVTTFSIFLHNHMGGTGTVPMDYGTMVGEARYSRITYSLQSSEIQGEDGTMLIRQIQDTRKIRIVYRDGSQETYEIAKEGNDMYYKILRLMDLIETGREGYPVDDLARGHLKDSLLEMGVMDQVRSMAGIRLM